MAVLLTGLFLLCQTALAGVPAGDTPPARDLDAVRDAGTLRLLAIARPGATCGPAARTTVERASLAALRAELGVQLTWHCVGNARALAAALAAGEGDLAIDETGLDDGHRATHALPQVVVRHWLVARDTAPLPRDVAALAGLRVAARHHGTAWDHLQAWREEVPSLVTIPLTAASTPADIAAGIRADRYDAALVDSGSWAAIAATNDGLRVAFDAGDAQAVRWAVHAAAPRLLAAIDRVIDGVRPDGTMASVRHGDLDDIRGHRVLRVIARPRPGSFELVDGEPRGFEYELLARFAKQQKLHVELVVPPVGADPLEWLRDGRGDIVGLPLAASRVKATQGITATRPYLQLETALIGADTPDDEAGLAGRSVVAIRDSRAWRQLAALRDDGLDIDLVGVAANTRRDTLLAAVADGRIGLAALGAPLPKGVEGRLTITATEGRHWATRADNPALREALDRYIAKEYRGVRYNVLARRHLGTSTEDRVQVAPPLSPYDSLVRRLAADYGLDWRLVVAQMYQESGFDPRARSTAGARGLLQVMPATGRELGFRELAHPEQGLHAGIKYLAYLRDRLDRDLPVGERPWFALAAYNAGYARVRAARRLAVELGLDPNRWFGHVERALFALPRADSPIARGHRSCRCGQPVEYVRRIHLRYAAYTRLGSRTQPSLAAIPSAPLQVASAITNAERRRRL